MIRRPPRSTLFPTRRSSDLRHVTELEKLANQRMEALVNALLRGKQARNEAGVPYTIGIRPDEVNPGVDRKSTRLNSSHSQISYAVFCLKKKKHRLHQSLADRPILHAIPIQHDHLDLRCLSCIHAQRTPALISLVDTDHP